MYVFNPYLTNDGSIGLYNSDFNDIYHSATGALSEAYEKFVLPVPFDIIMYKDRINILDICYGIGYNSKSFLNYIFENYLKNNSSKNNHIDKIDTNKITERNTYNIDTLYTDNTYTKTETNEQANNDTVHSYNIFPKISVTAIDNDKVLAFLSPFIKNEIKNFTNDSLNFEYKNIEKYLNKKFFRSKYKINKLINFLIFEKIAQKHLDFIRNQDVSTILRDKRYCEIFDNNFKGIYGLLDNKVYKPEHKLESHTFLHNIYYRHISNKYKSGLKKYNLANIDFDLIINDARMAIKNDKKIYNIIFLDAFTPAKCPCLWSYDFFNLLYNHLEKDGIILTYTTSPAVRNAMKEIGFYIGNIYNDRENKFLGTIAAKNKTLINHPLSEYDLGLLKTKAGILYRDKNLTALNGQISSARNREIENSTLLSVSQYKKMNKQQ